jgi:hypothetical protein
MMKVPKTNYVICVRAEESEDIEVRKVYEVLPDEAATKRGYLRVIDESGEDYLYPKECFAAVDLPGEAVRAFTSRPAHAKTGMQPTAPKTRRG